MFVIKPMAVGHLRTIEKFMSDDLLGLTSLPRDKHLLHQKLVAALASFMKEVSEPRYERYFFVLENIKTGEIGGISGIESRAGVDVPVYSYRIERVPAPNTDLPVPRKQLLLHFHAQRNAPTEIGSLYLLPSFRKEGLGRLLSLSRFLFIASFPNRFDNRVFAEMRGFVDEHGKSPFWRGLGSRFLNVKFSELMDVYEDIKDSTPLLVPQYPVYVSLLNQDAQEAIGRVHPSTEPALNLLMQEGFSLTNEVDIFDAGPRIEAETCEIRTIKHSRLAIVKALSAKPVESVPALVCNGKLEFRACYGPLIIDGDNDAVLPEDMAFALEVKPGDPIRYAPASTKTYSGNLP